MSAFQHIRLRPGERFMAIQEDAIRRRLWVPSTQSATYEKRRKAQPVREPLVEDFDDAVIDGRQVLGKNVTVHNRAKLTPDQAILIRAQFAVPFRKGTIKRLAQRYGVDARTITDIKNNITWTHLRIAGSEPATDKRGSGSQRRALRLAVHAQMQLEL